jgi:hypothetical protein
MIDFTRLLPLFASLRFVGHGGLVFGRVIQIMSRSNRSDHDRISGWARSPRKRLRLASQGKTGAHFFRIAP